MGELWFRVRDFFRYSKSEQRDLLFSVLIVALVFAYDDGREIFTWSHWIFNYLLVLFMVAGAFFVHTALQKIWALKHGLLAEYRAWPTGLVITFVFAMLFQGNFYILLPGGLAMTHASILRLGRWRYGENVSTRGIIAASGAIGNVLLATFCLMMSAQLGIFPEFFGLWAVINFWLMVYSLLPIPRLDGIHLLFWSRLVYVFIFSTLLGYVLLTLLNIYSWFFALLIGIVCWFLFYLFVESKG